MAAKNRPARAMGRCPDCSAAVEVEILKSAPGLVLPHGCPARICEYPGCRISALQDRMVRSGDGAWYCPPHGLLLSARALVALYRTEGDADWSEICAVIAEVLPDVIGKIEAAERV